MDECEFKNFCDSIGYAQPCENDEKDIAYCMVRITLNSPQFKKEYAKIPKDGKNPYETAMNNIPSVAKHKREQLRLEANAYAEGQQNPDPKQYANKKELEKAIRESYLYRHLDERKAFILFQIIQNHGLEE